MTTPFIWHVSSVSNKAFRSTLPRRERHRLADLVKDNDPLVWSIAQIEGALLETWLPTVFERLEELSLLCRARGGSVGAWIEDKNSGTVLLQHALRRGMRVNAIDSKLTSATIVFT